MNANHLITSLLPFSRAFYATNKIHGAGTRSSGPRFLPADAHIAFALDRPQGIERLAGIASLDLMTIANKKAG